MTSSNPSVSPSKQNPPKQQQDSSKKNPSQVSPPKQQESTPIKYDIDDRAQFTKILSITDPKEKLKQYQELYCKIQIRNNPQLKPLIEKDKMVLGSKETELKDYTSKVLYYNKLDIDPANSETMRSICPEKYPETFRLHPSRKERKAGKLNLLTVITNIKTGLEFINSMVWLDEEEIKNNISVFIDDKTLQLKNIIKSTDVFLGNRGPEDKKLLNHKEVCDTITDSRKILSIVGNNTPDKQDFIDVLEKLMEDLEKIRIYQRGIHDFEAYGYGVRDTSILRSYENELMRILGLKQTTTRAKKSPEEKEIDGQLNMFFNPNIPYDMMEQLLFKTTLPTYPDHKEYIKNQLKQDKRCNDNTKKLAEAIK